MNNGNQSTVDCGISNIKQGLTEKTDVVIMPPEGKTLVCHTFVSSWCLTRHFLFYFDIFSS